MPNIAALLKAEIARVARKQLRADTEPLKKTIATQRQEIAALKRMTLEMRKELTRLVKTAGSAAKAKSGADKVATSESSLRFSAKGLASQRKRLGLSAADCGKLVGASGLSIYKWESGKIRPRAKFLPALAELRTMGKKQAAARLQAI